MSFFAKIRSGLKRSTKSLSDGLHKISSSEAADRLEDLEHLLISADIGVQTTHELCAEIKKDKVAFGDEKNLRQYLATKIMSRLKNDGHGFIATDEIKSHKTPFVIFIIGANGCGKTTSIAKLAQYYKTQGLKVLLAAGDVFRAAGSEQLAVWGERLNIDVISAEQGSSATGLIYEAHAKALHEDYDLLLIDTAGRLHNKVDLMAELQKLNRILQKQDNTAPHSVLLVLDATNGKNSISAAMSFHETLPLDHLLLTKLDGTAKGGMIISLHEKLSVPIMAVGVGEATEDLLPFDSEIFTAALLDLPQNL